MKLMLKRIILTAAIPLMLIGCAVPEVPDLYWPEPPDQPRIKYIMDYRGPGDFKKGGLAANIVLGSDVSGNMRKPMSVHVAEDGKIYVTDTAASDVFIFDPVNQVGTTLGDMGAKVFFKPIGVATDTDGRIFVSDSQSDKVIAFDKDGKIIKYLSADTPFKQPAGIAADSKNRRLYVVDTHNHHINVFNLDDLNFITTISKRGREEGELNFPSHITVDDNGNIYVVDTMNGRVQIFDMDGRFLRAFGQFGDSPGMFARPKGIGVDSEGHIYVVDSAFNNVQIFNDEGQILMAFASYGNDRGQMILPAGLAIDKDDYIYVVDSWNRRVEKFEYLGEKAKARGSLETLKKKTK